MIWNITFGVFIFLLAGNWLDLKKSAALGLLCLLVFSLPIYHSESIGFYVLGLFGQLSIISLGLILFKLIKCSPKAPWVAAIVITVLGWLLNLSYLGVFFLPIYEFGFNPWMVGLVFLVVLPLIWLNQWQWVVLLLLGLMSHRFGLLESQNLWDYLLDIWLVIFSTGWLVVYSLYHLVKTLRRKLNV